MIVGHGDIASILNERTGAIFLASGVSNSQMKNEDEFNREKVLIVDAIHAANTLGFCLFYFGSISCFFRTSRYTKHKLEMEGIIKETCKNYNIIRIGNISWGRNPNTFINYIRNKQAKGEPVEIKDEFKYMISEDQLRLLTDNLPLKGKNEISVFGECKKVRDCI
jgi:hypothetical protein